MALTENDKMVYTAEILDYISRIPLDSIDDLPLLIKALRAIITPNSDTAISEHMQYGIMLICEYMSPEDLRCRSVDRPEFIAFCTNVIKTQIEKLEALTPEAKQAYIEKQSEIRLHPEELNAATNIAATLQTHWQMVQALAAPSAAITPSPVTLFEEITHSITHIRREAELAWRSSLSTQFNVYLPSLNNEQASNASRIATLYCAAVIASTVFAIRGMVRFYPATREENRTTPPLQYGYWTRTVDNWEEGASQHSRENFNILRKKNFRCSNQGQYFRHINLSQHSENQFSVTLELKPDTDRITHNNRHVAVAFALTRRGLTQNTPGVTSYPKPTIHTSMYTAHTGNSCFCFRGTAEEVLYALERLLPMIAELEGPANMPEAMQTELTEALRTHTPLVVNGCPPARA